MTTIEPGTLDDVDPVVESWVALAESQREHGSTILPAANRDEIRESVGSHALAGGLLVARRDGDVVGFVLFGPESDRFERDRSAGVVRYVYVAPEHRGKGLGTRLLEDAQARLAEQGCDVVRLEVMADNEAARRFYRRLGYDPHRVELRRSLDESDTHTN